MKNVEILLIIILFLSGCKSKVKDSKPKIKCEKWVEYILSIDERLDTSKVKGHCIKEIEYYNNGKYKKIIEHEPSTKIFEKITRYSRSGNITMISTYYDKKKMYGTIEEKDYDATGNEIKVTVYTLNEGKKIKEGIFNITYKLDNKKNIISTRMISEDNEITTAYDKKNIYENDLLVYSALKDTLGEIISENSYKYDNEGRLIMEILKIPKIDQVTEYNFEYKNGHKTKEIVKINDNILNIKQYEYKNNFISKIIIDDLKEQKKHIIYIESWKFKKDCVNTHTCK